MDHENTTIYRSLIGKLLYIANKSRSDVSYAVNYFSLGSCASQHCAKKALIYLGNTKDRKLHLGKLDDSGLTGYSDASFVGEKGKSQSGVLFTYHGSIVHWISRKQDRPVNSSTEAEYIALQLASDECVWIRGLLADFGEVQHGPTIIFEDNLQLVRLVHNGQINTRCKYLTVKLRVIQDRILRKHIDVSFIASTSQWADILTKSKQPANVGRLFDGTSLCDLQNRGVC